MPVVGIVRVGSRRVQKFDPVRSSMLLLVLGYQPGSWLVTDGSVVTVMSWLSQATVETSSHARKVSFSFPLSFLLPLALPFLRDGSGHFRELLLAFLDLPRGQSSLGHHASVSHQLLSCTQISGAFQRNRSVSESRIFDISSGIGRVGSEGDGGVWSFLFEGCQHPLGLGLGKEPVLAREG